MNEIVKYVGVILLLVGVVIMLIPAFTHNASNGLLLTGLALMVIGYIGHIVINKRFC